MAAKNNNALFYTCSLIEYIGRTKKETRCKIVEDLGKDTIQRIYNYSDVFHCEPIEKVAMEFIEEYRIQDGNYDNIGEVYERLIEDCYTDNEIMKGIWEVYHSWIDAVISDYNTDFYYQSRDYIAACYKEGEVL